jgi:hypothetical protein
MDAAQAAYEAGDWREAANQAASVGGAEGYAFASGAILAQLMVELDNPDRRDLMREALRFANYAYRDDEDNIQARLYLAGSIGYQGRFMGNWRAFAQRLPHRGRNLLESVVADDPTDAWAVAMLGAWHLEVIRRGGSSGTRMLDASIDAGLGLYSNAIALDPLDPAPRYFMALGLVALDGTARDDVVREQLDISMALTPRDAFEAGIQVEAGLLLNQLGDRRTARDWANERLMH